MTENTENTFSAYLGPEFQQRLIWQLLVEPEFAEKIIPDLAIEYFDDPNLRRLFIIMLQYFKEYDKVPNLQNRSIHQAINEYKTPNNVIEEESLFGVIKRITLWNERIINKQMLWDGDVVQKSATFFIKQQEYRKLAEHTQAKVKDGGIRSKYVVAEIEEKFQKIALIGDEDDDCESVTEGIEKALRKEFRETIPTGILAIDELTGGGLGKGEMGIILAPSGVGKTTALTIIANTAYDCEKNVAHIVFEDTKDQIKRKHYTIWADSALSRLGEDDEHDRVLNVAIDKTKAMEGKGRLLVKRFSQEDTTIRDIRNWMISYEKKYGFKFDILVLDYLDCVESHKKSPDRNEAELAVVKGFEAIAADFDIPAWTAIQSNRSGIGAEIVEAQQTGGSIKRMQKAHFFMSIAKTPAQQDANFATVRIIKARFAKDGQMFEDCIFNNDTMKIIIDDPRYRGTKNYKGLKHHDEQDINNLEKKAKDLSSSQGKLNAAISQHTEGALLDKVNSSTINDMLHDNKQPETNDDITPQTDFHPEAEFHEKQIKEDGESRSTEFKNIENYHISTTRTDLSPDEVKQILTVVDEAISEGATEGAVEGASGTGLLELDETENIEILDEGISEGINEGVSDAVSEGVNDAVKPELLDFTGDTETTVVNEPEEISVPEEKGITYGEELTEEKSNDDELNQILNTDPDAPKGEDEEFQNMLVKKRDYQNVKKPDKK